MKVGTTGTGKPIMSTGPAREYLSERMLKSDADIAIEHKKVGADYQERVIQEQIKIAARLPLDLKQSDICLDGHAIECRINAEHPESFLPSPGKITAFHAPGGFGIRFDSHIYHGYTVPPYYDSLIGKLIAHGKTRREAIARMQQALKELVIEGIDTNQALHKKILADDGFQKDAQTIHFLEHWLRSSSKKGSL